MPELPEVESTAKNLRQKLCSHTITDVLIEWPNMIGGHSPKTFRNSLCGATISEVARRGKYLIFELGERKLVSHLKMSGRMEVVSASKRRSPYDRIVFTLNRGKEFRFRDPRKFGRMKLVTDLDRELGHLGPDPLSGTLTGELFRQMLSSRKGAIKPLLLNQTFVAGLGNIYVDESLWSAEIHPRTPANSIPEEKVGKLFRAMRSILRRAIKMHGTDFGDGVVKKGSYKPKVYGRSGERCVRCKNVVQRIVVGQRGTHICSQCQKFNG